jgi:hypothetical protein
MSALSLEVLGSISADAPPLFRVTGPPGQHIIVELSTDRLFFDSNWESRRTDNFFSSAVARGPIVLDDSGHLVFQIPSDAWNVLIGSVPSGLSARALPVQPIGGNPSPVIDLPLNLAPAAPAGVPASANGPTRPVVAPAAGAPPLPDGHPAPAAVALADVAAASGMTMPPVLGRYLAEAGVNSLADLVQAGGMTRLADLPLSMDEPIVKALDAHAKLGTISDDAHVNGRLIAAGFADPIAIARTPQADFVAGVGGQLDTVAALTIQTTARAQVSYLNNVLTTIAAARANGWPSPISPGPVEPVPPPCSCQDCQAAVSPLAYLADLIAYAVTHIVDSGSPINLAWLTGNFHQPFGDLPASCQSVEEQVRECRICIEVLRSYLQDHPPNSDAMSRLNISVHSYLYAAYAALLTKIGTSYAEIRLARTAGAAVRKALADRLGIDLYQSRPDQLDRLLFMPSQLTEMILDILFGLADTTRDPLSRGGKIGDGSPPQVHRWRLDGVEWRRNTDDHGFVHLSLSLTSGKFWAEIHKDATRTQLVAVGQRADRNGPIKLAERNGSGLTGLLEINYSSDTSAIHFAAIPLYVAWRLKNLRTIWYAQDWPIDLPDGPIVDPDLIGPDDFRIPFGKPSPTAPDRAFDLWLRRRGWVDGALDALANRTKTVNGKPVPDLQAMLTSMYQPIMYATAAVTPWASTTQPTDFGNIWRNIQQGIDVGATQLRLKNDLRLTVEAFSQLMTLKAKDDAASADPRNQPLAPVEWSDVRSILVQAQKLALRDVWLAEEVAQTVRLGPAEFWPSPRAPTVGAWPPMSAAPPVPLIDPTGVKLEDLPDLPVGRRAQMIWRARQRRLAQILADLRTERVTNGFDAMLRHALGQPNVGDPLPDDPQVLIDNLNNNVDVDNTKAEIVTDLHMSPEAFARLMTVKAKDAQADPMKKPTNADWQDVYSTLTNAQKEKREYPTWVHEENDAAAGVPYWMARKAALPRWRSTADDRAEWVRDLTTRSGNPLIDPDLVGPADLRHGMVNPVLNQWVGRDQWMRDIITSMDAERLAKPTPLAGIDALITDGLFTTIAGRDAFDFPPVPCDARSAYQASLQKIREAAGLPRCLQEVFGDPLPDLDGVLARLDNGTDPARTRDEITWSLYLTIDAFRRLMQLRAKSAVPGGLTTAEWQELFAILAQAALVRQAMSLTATQSAGSDISIQAGRLGLEPGALSSLARIRALAAQVLPILDDEWNEVYSILAEAQKRRRFADWRDKEKSQSFTLAPDWFGIPPLDPTAFPTAAPSLRQWRARAADKQQWQATLQSRIDQQIGLFQSTREPVESSEETLLPMLRDALISAATWGFPSLLGGANWVTKHLLIDASESGCRKTSRVEQAIETVQGLLFSVRNGELNDTFPNLELHAEHFDEEWQWVGSYATWRAAMFVFLYPENILLPTLRKHQTPGFAALLGAIRSNRRLTPDQACAAAATYSRYFEDVCTLQLGACCDATMLVRTGDCRDRSWGQPKTFNFMFGRSNSSRLYWCVSDPGADPSYRQTFWEQLSGAKNVLKVLGATLYEHSSKERYAYVFFQAADADTQKLQFLRYDLETATWQQEPTSLELPDKLTAFSDAKVRQLAPAIPPTLAVWMNDGRVMERRLNAKGEDWDDAPFQPIKVNGTWGHLGKGANSPAWEDFDSSSIGLPSRFAVTGDFDGDGHPEIAIAPQIVAGQSTGPAFWVMHYDNASQTWVHLSPVPGNLIQADLVCSTDNGAPAAKFAVAGDFDKDGRAELAVAFDNPGGDGNLFWVMDFNPTTRTWQLLPSGASWAFHANLRCSMLPGAPPAKLAVSGDFDGDGKDELAVLPVAGGDDGNNFWVMTYDIHHGVWAHLSPYFPTSGIPPLLDADIVCSIGRKCPAISAVVGDFDGDGRAEIAVAADVIRSFPPIPESAFWVMDFRPARKDWVHLRPPWNIGDYDFLCAPIFATKHLVAADFDGDGKSEIAVTLDIPRTDSNTTLGFVKKLTPPFNEWKDLGTNSNLFLNASFQCSDRYAGKFIAAGDIDGDGRGEFLMAAAKVSDTEASDFWVMKYDPATQLWAHQISVPWSGDLTRKDFQCSPLPLEAKFALAGDFDGDGRIEIAAAVDATDARGNAFWVMRYDPTPTGFRSPCNYPNFAPVYGGPYDITEILTRAQLEGRRVQIQQAFLTNLHLNQPASSLTYLEEAWFFVPVYLALQLERAGQYTAALDWLRTVYDYTLPPADRKVYYGLVLEEKLSTNYHRPADWLLDPLNPHEIAATRANTYTRFTLLTIVECLLVYADDQFTQDTGESVSRARTLYSAALNLEALPELNQNLNGCDHLIATLDLQVGDPVWQPYWLVLKAQLSGIADPVTLSTLVNQLQPVLNSDADWSSKLTSATQLIASARSGPADVPAFAMVLARRDSALGAAYLPLLADPAINAASRQVSAAAADRMLTALGAVSSAVTASGTGSPTDSIPWLTNAQPASAGTAVALVAAPALTERSLNGQHGSFGATVSSLASENPGALMGIYWPEGGQYIPAPTFDFCIPPNPIVKALRLHAELDLFKIRNCRNISGMERALDTYAAPTDTQSGLPTIGAGGQLSLPSTVVLRPTPYRYSVIIERAKQMVQLAAQIEGAMLSALEKRDAEAYSALKARQDLQIAKAGVRLNDLQVKEAEGNVRLAQLQQQKAQLQADHWQSLLDAGQSTDEMLGLDFLLVAAGLSVVAATLQTIAGVSAYYDIRASAATALGEFAAASASLAQASSTVAGYFAALASYERRAQEWQFNQSQAAQDVRIGGQQIQIADDHVRVVGQERTIGILQSDNAQATVDFLANKFTNVELYDWMSGILEGVYSFFLQQATSIARLAADQLGFERQEVPPAFIRADYWQAPVDSSSASTLTSAAPDRRGLTGSARLLQDIYQLDAYAFETNKRKLQLSATVSLAQNFPTAFQRFRETGVMTFRTPMEMFDRQFPDHYLRLVRRVKTSVIALVPPNIGIRATLTSSRISRVVIGGDLYQTVSVQRGPDMVALTSPRDATGIFELDPQAEMLLPFEGTGVDTTWEFRMPKPANPFSYDTIADVLLTIEYTALNSFDYGHQVIQSLSPNVSIERPFSFRQQFADQWYDLNNPDQTATPMTVQFDTRRADFAGNLEGPLKIAQVVLYFASSPKQSFEVAVDHFHFTEHGSAAPVGGAARSIDGVISTRSGSAASWQPIIGKQPLGTWELALPDTPEVRALFANEVVTDILFALTYTGRAPAWPA